MSMDEETTPATLLGGPHDGTEVDVRASDTEVRRPTEGGGMVRYFRASRTAFAYGGYVENPPPPSAPVSEVECGLCGSITVKCAAGFKCLNCGAVCGAPR